MEWIPKFQELFIRAAGLQNRRSGSVEHLRLKVKGLKVWPVPAKEEVQIQLDGYKWGYPPEDF